MPALQAGCLNPPQCSAVEAKLQATLAALATLHADSKRVGLGPEADPELDAFMVRPVAGPRQAMHCTAPLKSS